MCGNFHYEYRCASGVGAPHSTSTSLLHTLRRSKRILHLSTWIVVAKTDSRSFYTPPPRRFPVVKTYSPSFYKPTHVAMVKADSPSFQKHCTRFAAVKKDSPSCCKPPTHFVVFNMDYLIFYKVPTCFAVLKTNPPCLLHALWWSKWTLRASTSLLHTLWLSKRTLHAS